MTALRLHSFPLSGHAHRARLMLALLGLQAEVVDVDLRGGAQKQPSYLAMNAFGQVPYHLYPVRRSTPMSDSLYLITLSRSLNTGLFVPIS